MVITMAKLRMAHASRLGQFSEHRTVILMLPLPRSQWLPHQVKCKIEATEVTASKDKAVVEKQSRYEAEEASEQERRKIH